MADMKQHIQEVPLTMSIVPDLKVVQSSFDALEKLLQHEDPAVVLTAAQTILSYLPQHATALTRINASINDAENAPAGA